MTCWRLTWGPHCCFPGACVVTGCFRSLAPCAWCGLQLSNLDDDHTNDEITDDMFVSFCRQNGFVPPASSAGASILFS